MINAQLEGAESLLGNLRGELLALDTNLSPGCSSLGSCTSRRGSLTSAAASTR